MLDWDSSHARTYKIQASLDAVTWQDIHYGQHCPGGVETIRFAPVDARHVRVYCIEKATTYAMSLRSLEVHGEEASQPRDVHFLRLRLTDASGKQLSENVYWRGARELDYRSLSTLPPVRLQTTVAPEVRDGRSVLVARVANPADSPAAAFAIHVQLHDSRTGERILPIIAPDNYFTLMRGETKEVVVAFENAAGLIGNSTFTATAFNSAR